MGTALDLRRPPRHADARDDDAPPSWRVPAVAGFEAVLAEQHARLAAAGRTALSDFATALAREGPAPDAPERLRPGA